MGIISISITYCGLILQSCNKRIKYRGQQYTYCTTTIPVRICYDMLSQYTCATYDSTHMPRQQYRYACATTTIHICYHSTHMRRQQYTYDTTAIPVRICYDNSNTHMLTTVHICYDSTHMLRQYTYATTTVIRICYDSTHMRRQQYTYDTTAIPVRMCYNNNTPIVRGN